MLRTENTSEPRWLGFERDCAITVPSASNRLQEASSASFTTGENEPRIRLHCISSTMLSSR